MNETSERKYADARSRLVQIETQLRDPDVDIDVLESLVTEAAELIAFCNQRIESVQASVNDVFGQAAA